VTRNTEVLCSYLEQRAVSAVQTPISDGGYNDFFFVLSYRRNNNVPKICVRECDCVIDELPPRLRVY